MEENHIRGYDFHTDAYGLLYNNELIAVITINKDNKVLNKICVKIGINIVDGIITLFNTIQMKNSLIAYSDLRFDDSETYLNLGFKIDHICEPDYMYINNGKISEENGYRIFDAGKVCFVY